MNKTKNEICLWRDRIDKIDLELVQLLNKRANCAKIIGKLKLKLGDPVLAPDREKEVIQNVTAANSGPLSAKAIKCIFQRIIKESRSVEQVMNEECKEKGKSL